MSGGHWEYLQYKLSDIYNELEEKIADQGKEIPEKERLPFYDKEYYERYPEEKYYTTYPKEVEKIFLDAIEIIKKAEIYMQRIDWYLSGDDGDESLISRLDEELKKANLK